MNWLYFLLLLVAFVLLLIDAFSSTVNDRTTRYAVRLLPLALAFWVLVPLIQAAKHL